MSFDVTLALKHFKKADPTMARLLQRGLKSIPPLEIPKGRTSAKYFEAIVSSIVSQQISVKAADAVLTKLKKGVGKLTPDNLRHRSVDELRTYGLSRQKATYIIKSAEVWHDLPVRQFHGMDNESVVEALTTLHGIGRWTAEMFLMFTLARPDVFSMGDWGLMISIKNNYGLDSTKKTHKKKIATLVTSWAPYRTLAALSLWHHKDNRPALD